MNYRKPTPQEGFSWLVQDISNLYRNRKQSSRINVTRFGYIDVLRIIGITAVAILMIVAGFYLLFW